MECDDGFEGAASSKVWVWGMRERDYTTRDSRIRLHECSVGQHVEESL
jgi:hypothetical protein